MPAFFAPAPASQREGAGQQHAATQAAQREFVILAVKVQQAGAARFHFGYPCLQGGHFTDLGVFVHDFDVGAVHRAPAFGVGPAARVDVRQAYVQLGQVVFSHFQHFEFDRRRVVVLGPVELGEAGEHFLVRCQRGRTVGLLSGEQAFLVEVLGDVVRFLVFGECRAGCRCP